MTPKKLPDPSPRLASSKDDFIYVSDDTASDKADASGGKPFDETLPSVQAAVQSLEETGEIGSTIRDGKQTSNSKDEREPPYTSTSSTPLDQRQLNHSAGFSFAEPADCLTDVPPTISRIRAPTPSMPASSRPKSRSPEPQLWDTVSTHTSCTSMSAAGKDAEETDDQNCTETNSPEKSNYNSSALEYTCDEEPLMSQMHPRAQSKRSRESLANHVAEQPGAEGLRGALDDPEYCPSTSDELEDYSDSSSGDEEQPSGKRRKFRTESRRISSRSQQSVHCESAGLDQASELISATQKDAHAVAEPTDAVFDEWILQDVVLKRTIMAGKATFLFQFDWDLCMKHGSEAGQVLKRSNQQSRGRSTVSGTKRKDRKLRDETKGRRCGVCGKPGHNARTCQ